MERNSKDNPKEDAADISKIYEVIRGKGFIQDLWLDVLSDLRQKPTYVHLKNMVEKVIETSVANYATKPKDHEERLRTRTTFTDLGIMTYTIDALISDVLKKKLKDELGSMISRVIEDHNHMTNSKVDKTKAVIMLEDIGKLLCSSSKNDDLNEPHASNGTSGPSKRRLSDKTDEKQPAAKKANRLNSMEKENSWLKNDNLSKACSNIVNSKSRSPSKRPKSKNSGANTDENSYVDVAKARLLVSDDEDDNHSIRSVSSVHTSDLSSFEDDISISSEDENGIKFKKRVSLKLAKDLYSCGRLSDLHKTHQRTEEQVSPDHSEKHFVDSSSQRSSTRMRKPNYKYASDDVVCPMKLNLSQTDLYISDKEMQEEVISTDGSEIQQSSSLNIALKRQGRLSKELKNSMSKKNSVQESESSNESDNSLPSLPSIFKKGKKLTAVKRGRPRKDNLLTEESSVVEQTRRETKVKRGRPSKSSIEGPVAIKTQCVLDNMLPTLEKKLQLQTGTQHTAQTVSQLNEMNTDLGVKCKKGRPSNNNAVTQVADEPIQHSVESFSKLEESLCLKDNKVNALSSPSKSKTKSYDTSDLYKPRSDFRIFNSTKGSRALTLFSN